MKFGNQSRSSSLIINMIFKIVDLDPKSKTWPDLVSKLQCARFLWNLALNKLSKLIIDILIRIDDLDPVLQICEIWSQNWNFFQILWNLALEQMEHAYYEYSTWNWLSWPKIIDSGKFGWKGEMCSNFHEVWHSEHFWISFNKVMNLIKGLRNVKNLKNFFFQRGTLYPVKHLMSFLKKTCLTRCWILHCILKCRVITLKCNTVPSAAFLRCSLRKNVEICGVFKQEYPQWRVI